ncbi:MAG: hypothetical protein DRZ82_07235 [Thermoprotei archaeon]|nr:MAG: hypothetical protein DRZ82_07235 [Thermoprotei archaeon]
MSSALITHLLNKWRKSIVKRIKRAKRVAIIHHWDTDGVASAVLISECFPDKCFSYHIPRIGLYGLEAIDVQDIKKAYPDIIIIVDYGITKDVVEQLKHKVKKEVIVIDHHLTDLEGDLLCNPIGIIHDEDLYPSTTWLIKELFKVRQHMDIIALGVIGDYGKYLEQSILSNIIGNMIKEEGLSINQLVRASQLIDSCYRVGDYEGIHHAREVLKSRGIIGILEDKTLHKNLNCVNKEIERILLSIKPVEVRKPLRIFEVETKNYITSYLGRELSYRYKDEVIVMINYVKNLDLRYIYVRSYKYDLSKALKKLKDRGLCIGGKNHVFVITCKARDYIREKDLTLSVLMETLSGD